MSCQGVPLIIAGCCSDKLYYEHHQAWRLATNVQARCRALTYQMTERSAYLPQQNAHSGNGFSPAATPAFIEPAVSPPSEQAWLPALTQGENRFRDQETCWRITPEKHQLNNLTLSLAVSFAWAGLIFTRRTNTSGLGGITGLSIMMFPCHTFPHNHCCMKWKYFMACKHTAWELQRWVDGLSTLAVKSSPTFFTIN